MSPSTLFTQYLLHYMSRSNTTNRSRQNADYAAYRPCRLSTFLSYTCLHLLLWLAFIGSRYKIVFNISESLLFITKPEVIGSLHRRFPHTIFFTRLLNQSYILRLCSRWINNKLIHIQHNFVTWAKKMWVKVKGATRYKREKNSVCTVCSLRGLRFGVTDTRYSNVTCTVRDTERTKSTQTNKIKTFLKRKGTRL